MCTSFVDPISIDAFVACRLIPLNKNPGVRPIGICETVRRIICKCILLITKSSIQSAAGPLQLCTGHIASCEAAVHVMNEIFSEDATEGILLVEASNAFNNLNHSVALHNCQVLNPSLTTVLINLYRGNANLFVGGKSILSQEGTIQGDPLSMAMYALSTVPLISAVETSNIRQTWYADDASAGWKLCQIRSWWDQLELKGPKSMVTTLIIRRLGLL